MSGGVLTGTEDRPCDRWPSTISKRLSLLSTHTCLPQSPTAPATTNARLSRLGAPSLVSVNLADNRLHTLKALVPLSRLPQLSRLALEDEGLVFWLVIGVRATKKGGVGSLTRASIFSPTDYGSNPVCFLPNAEAITLALSPGTCSNVAGLLLSCVVQTGAGGGGIEKKKAVEGGIRNHVA